MSEKLAELGNMRTGYINHTADPHEDLITLAEFTHGKNQYITKG